MGGIIWEELHFDITNKIIAGSFEISFNQNVIENLNFIEIVLPYNPNALNPTANTTVMYWDEELSAWSNKGIWDVSVSQDLQTVSFKTNHNSVFAIIQEKSNVPGDLNGDYSVDLDDYYEVFELTYAKCTGDASYNPVCDFDKDGCVTLVDLYTLYQYYLDYQATLNP